MIKVRLKTDKDRYSSNKAIKYVVQLGELKNYLTEKALIELKSKLNTFAIPVVVDCKHENEIMKQGDGFYYSTCGDCGDEL